MRRIASSVPPLMIPFPCTCSFSRLLKERIVCINGQVSSIRRLAPRREGCSSHSPPRTMLPTSNYASHLALTSSIPPPAPMQIDDTTASLVVAQLLFLEADNPEKPISLYINSPGGYVTSGLAIYDTMQVCRVVRSMFHVSRMISLQTTTIITTTTATNNNHFQYIHPPVSTVCAGQAGKLLAQVR